MRSVTQKEPMGRGIACVASVAGRSYSLTKELSDKPENSVLKGYYCRDLVRALSKGGLNYEFSKVNSKNKKLINKNGSIVFIKRSKRYPAGHFLVKTEEGWMNPWINYPEISPAKAGFQKSLPGIAQLVIYRSRKK